MTSNELEIFKQSILDDVRVMMQTTGQVTQYIGARYVPLFADPLEWNGQKEYEPLTIVLYQGNSFTSRQFVPRGIDISNTDFWANTGNYNAQIEQYRAEVNRYHKELQEFMSRAIFKTPEDFGAKGDGIADDSTAIKNALESEFNISGLIGKTYKVNDVIVTNSKDKRIENLNINGNLQFLGTESSATKITSATHSSLTAPGIAPGDIVYIFKKTDDTSANKRQVCKMLNNNLTSDYIVNIDTSYQVAKITGISNIVLDNCHINGHLRLYLVSDFNVSNVTVTGGKIITYKSFNVNYTKCVFNYMNRDDWFAVSGGSAHIDLTDVKSYGGGTESDNAAFKFDECFHCTAENVYAGNCDPSLNLEHSTFHGFFIEGDYTEDGFPNNPAFNIKLSNCSTGTGFYSSFNLRVADKVALINCQGETLDCGKTISALISNSYFKNVSVLTCKRISATNCVFNTIQQGDLNNLHISDSRITKFVFKQNVKNVSLINCQISNLTNSSISPNTITGVVISNCTVSDECALGGFKGCKVEVTTQCKTDINAVNECDIAVHSISGNGDYAIKTQNLFNSILRYCSFGDYTKGLYTDYPAGLDTCTILKYGASKERENDQWGTRFTKYDNQPSSGKWNVGDIVLKRKPTSSEIGWICIESGTPGTWTAINPS